jgi:hypothetical protein
VAVTGIMIVHMVVVMMRMRVVMPVRMVMWMMDFVILRCIGQDCSSRFPAPASSQPGPPAASLLGWEQY